MISYRCRQNSHAACSGWCQIPGPRVPGEPRRRCQCPRGHPGLRR